MIPAKDIGWMVYSAMNLAFILVVWWFDSQHPGVQFPLWIRVPVTQALFVLFCICHGLYWYRAFKGKH